MGVDITETGVGEEAGLNMVRSQSIKDEDKENKQDKSNALDDSEDEERKAYVVKYQQQAAFPFEIGETVWIMKPGYRAPQGEFRITKAYPNDMFELESCATNATHHELVAGKDLQRDI